MQGLGADAASTGKVKLAQENGLSVSYTKPDDWFARLDYTRRIVEDSKII